jgi:hypothetical protein
MKVEIFDVDTFIAAPKFGFVAGTTSLQLETGFTGTSAEPWRISSHAL